jgi:hypothetical protein
MSTVGQNLAEIRDIDANNLPNLKKISTLGQKFACISSRLDRRQHLKHSFVRSIPAFSDSI